MKSFPFALSLLLLIAASLSACKQTSSPVTIAAPAQPSVPPAAAEAASPTPSPAPPAANPSLLTLTPAQPPGLDLLAPLSPSASAPSASSQPPAITAAGPTEVELEQMPTIAEFNVVLPGSPSGVQVWGVALSMDGKFLCPAEPFSAATSVELVGDATHSAFGGWLGRDQQWIIVKVLRKNCLPVPLAASSEIDLAADRPCLIPLPTQEDAHHALAVLPTAGPDGEAFDPAAPFFWIAAPVGSLVEGETILDDHGSLIGLIDAVRADHGLVRVRKVNAPLALLDTAALRVEPLPLHLATAPTDFDFRAPPPERAQSLSANGATPTPEAASTRDRSTPDSDLPGYQDPSPEPTPAIGKPTGDKLINGGWFVDPTGNANTASPTPGSNAHSSDFKFPTGPAPTPADEARLAALNGPALAAACDALLKSYPDAPEAWYLAALGYARAGANDRSLASAATLPKLVPKDWEASLFYGQQLDHAGQTDAALDAYQAAVDNGAPLLRIGIPLSDTLVKTQDETAALGQLEAITRQEPEFYAAWQRLGDLHEKKGELTSAIQAHFKALQLDPQSIPDWTALGRIYEGMGAWPDAVQSYHSLVVIDPRNEAAWHHLGSALSKTGANGEALAAFHRALALDGNDQNAQAEIARLESGNTSAEQTSAAPVARAQ